MFKTYGDDDLCLSRRFERDRFWALPELDDLRDTWPHDDA